jgi:universal stress protein family protein
LLRGASLKRKRINVTPGPEAVNPAPISILALRKEAPLARILVPILGEADKIAADLIVLGGKGYSAGARMLLGSTAEQVVRFARCSVLVARHSPDYAP